MHDVTCSDNRARYRVAITYVAVAEFDVEAGKIVPPARGTAECAHRISPGKQRTDNRRSDKSSRAGDHYESQRHRSSTVRNRQTTMGDHPPTSLQKPDASRKQANQTT